MRQEHNIKRYGELWPDYRIELGLEILNKLKQWIVISGGWAWHFMSEENHTEYKHAHDHKDIDIFVHPVSQAGSIFHNGYEMDTSQSLVIVYFVCRLTKATLPEGC